MRFNRICETMELRSSQDSEGFPQIYDVDADKVVVDGQVMTQELKELFDNLTPELFIKYMAIFNLNHDVADLGPAFIDIQGKFYHMDEFGIALHDHIGADLAWAYVKTTLKDLDIDDDTIEDFYEEILDKLKSLLGIPLQELLEDITNKASLVRVNTGHSNTDDRFYTVIRNAPTKYQQYALEEFFNLGADKDEEVLVFCGPNATHNMYKLKNYNAKDIVQRINRYFTTGILLEKDEGSEACMENVISETIAEKTLGEWLKQDRGMTDDQIKQLFDYSYTYGGNIVRAEARTGRTYTNPREILGLGTRSITHICYQTSDRAPMSFIALQTLCAKPSLAPLFVEKSEHAGFRKNSRYTVTKRQLSNKSARTETQYPDLLDI